MAFVSRQEWLNQNAGRAYPFRENAMRRPRDAGGNELPALALPNYVVVDMIFTVPGAGDPRVFLSRFVLAGSLLTFVFGETVSGDVIAAVTVDTRTHTPNKGYALVGSSDWFDARGWLTIGDLSRLSRDLPDGAYEYAPEQTMLETRVIRPALRGVRSLRVVDSDNVSEPVYGHVKLLAGENIRLEYDAGANGIWIHAEPNAGYRELCECESTAQTNVVRTINGIPLRDVTIVGDGECVEVKTAGDKVIISDKCSKPCCGCPELDLLNESVRTIEASLSRLETYSEKLSERVATFVSNFVMTINN